MKSTQKLPPIDLSKTTVHAPMSLTLLMCNRGGDNLFGPSSDRYAMDNNGADSCVTKKGVLDAVDALLSKRSRDDSSPQPSKKKQKVVAEDMKKPVAAAAAAAAAASSEPSKKLEGIANYETKDVLCGRGGGTNLHEGNRFYRELILSHRRAYDDASKVMKPEISREIVMQIRERGGRFLRKGKDDLYHDIGDAEAKAKTSQALRHRTFELRNTKDPDRVKANGRWKQSPARAKTASPTTSRSSTSMPATKSMAMVPNLQDSTSSSTSSSSTAIDHQSLLREALRRQQFLEASRNSRFPSSGGMQDNAAFMSALANLKHQESMLSLDRAIHEAEKRRLASVASFPSSLSLLSPLNQGLFSGVGSGLSRGAFLGRPQPIEQRRSQRVCCTFFQLSTAWTTLSTHESESNVRSTAIWVVARGHVSIQER